MTVRTIRQTIAFRKPFYLKGVDRLLSPGDYGVVTDEELIEGLSFSAYHRISTVMFVPAEFGCAVEMVTIDPLDLQAAIDRDARERIDDPPLHNRGIDQTLGLRLRLKTTARSGRHRFFAGRALVR